MAKNTTMQPRIDDDVARSVRMAIELNGRTVPAEVNYILRAYYLNRDAAPLRMAYTNNPKKK